MQNSKRKTTNAKEHATRSGDARTYSINMLLDRDVDLALGRDEDAGGRTSGRLCRGSDDNQGLVLGRHWEARKECGAPQDRSWN